METYPMSQETIDLLAAKDAEIANLKIDAARLDKLPDCFHMLRTDAYGYKWWLTRHPDKVYLTVREAIDAHQEPKP